MEKPEKIVLSYETGKDNFYDNYKCYTAKEQKFTQVIRLIKSIKLEMEMEARYGIKC